MQSSPNQGGVYAVSAVLAAAATIAIGLRGKVRRLKQANFGLDDVFIAVALLLVYALAIIMIIGAAQGTIGTHTSIDPVTGELITTKHEVDISKLAFISQMVAIPTYGMLKLSVLLLYRRIFFGQGFQRVLLLEIIIVAAWVIAFFFATLFQCGSYPAYYWQSSAAVKKHCSDYKYIQLGHAASDVGTDLLVLGTPIPMIWRLQMTTFQKIGLQFIFLLGLLATAAGTARTVIIAEDLYETTTGARDLRGIQTNVMVWSYVEAGVGVIAACLPTFKPLLSLRTAESIVNSVRSKISLGSLDKSRQAESQSDDVDKLTRNHSDGFEMGSSDQVAKDLYGTESSTLQTNVKHTLSSHSDLPGDQILVTNGVSREVNRREDSLA